MLYKSIDNIPDIDKDVLTIELLPMKTTITLKKCRALFMKCTVTSVLRNLDPETDRYQENWALWIMNVKDIIDGENHKRWSCEKNELRRRRELEMQNSYI